jgi:predicted Zn-dependent peptidase
MDIFSTQMTRPGSGTISPEGSMPKTSKTNIRSYTQAPDSQYQKTTLSNGVRVVSESIPYVRSVSLGIWADVGSRDESPEQNGISHFLEHMVFKGTKKRSVKEIAQSLESLGGYLNAFTTKEQTCFYARVLDTHVPQSMDVLTDLLLNATFRRHELEKEKLVVIEELKNAEDDPEDIIHDYFEKALFPNHSLGFPIIGTEENLRRFGRQDLQAHVATHYHPARIVVAAAGNVDHKALVRLAEKYFKRYDTDSKGYDRLPGPLEADKGKELEYPRQIKQAHICLGTVAYSIQHPDRYPLLVLNGLLGEGMSSRLYQVIREKHGFAYSVYSFVTMLSDTGVFGAYIGTDTKKIEPAIELVYKELALLKTKRVSRGELERTKSQIKGNLMLGLENMSGRMMRLGSGELYYGSYIPLDNILRKIDAVTPETVQKVANDLFHRENFSTVVVRPA